MEKDLSYPTRLTKTITKPQSLYYRNGFVQTQPIRWRQDQFSNRVLEILTNGRFPIMFYRTIKIMIDQGGENIMQEFV